MTVKSDDPKIIGLRTQLEAAKQELEAWGDKQGDYTGNNPDKYEGRIRAARAEVRRIEEELEKALPPEQQSIQTRLDAAFPYSKSKTVVQFEGRRYQIRYFPLQRSRSRKTVTVWGHEWVDVTNDPSVT